MIGTYERTANRLLKGQPRPQPVCRLVNGKFVIGTRSLHRTQQGCRWRMFWRIKQIGR
jgi:hypothetical protein